MIYTALMQVKGLVFEEEHDKSIFNSANNIIRKGAGCLLLHDWLTNYILWYKKTWQYS